MPQKIQIRRGYATDWETVDPVLSSGELGVELDTSKIKFGDGDAPWSDRPYVGDGVITGTVGTIFTSDTGEEYKLIGFSNGTVRAIPIGATPPDTPSVPTLDVRLSVVILSWPAAARATSYVVSRNGSDIGIATGPSYRDLTVTSGSTYTYRVQAADNYGQRSAQSGPAVAFIDPALNVAPVTDVRAWPTTYNDPGKTLIRVNATDIDAQQLELTLGITAGTGTLTPTADPSVWELTIP